MFVVVVVVIVILVLCFIIQSTLSLNGHLYEMDTLCKTDT